MSTKVVQKIEPYVYIRIFSNKTEPQLFTLILTTHVSVVIRHIPVWKVRLPESLLSQYNTITKTEPMANMKPKRVHKLINHWYADSLSFACACKGRPKTALNSTHAPRIRESNMHTWKITTCACSRESKKMLQTH
jgi:hypothetical protein